MDKWNHNINETSALFQGHVDQLFSLNKIGFRINAIYEDQNRIQELNNERYRRSFVQTINKLLEQRGKDGYEHNKITDLDQGLKIIYPKITNGREDEQSGTFELYPRTAICPKCHRYVRLGVEGDICSCNVKLTQFTFIAFCDECGAHYPIDPMSNVLNDCTQCHLKNGLRIVHWGQPDDLLSYTISCINCKHEERLVLYPCDHKDHQTGKIRSTKPLNRFRGVPARAGAILHPKILTLPDIPTISEAGPHDNNDVTRSRLLSESFNYFFKSLDLKIQESLLYLPEFWDILTARTGFWSKSHIIELRSLMGLEEFEIGSWDLSSKMLFIQGLLIEARNKIIMSNKQVEIRNKYGIDEIEECLNDVKDKSLDEREQQGIYLVRASQTYNDGSTGTYAKQIPESGYPDGGAFLEKLGIERVVHISNLEMLQALLGLVEGSMRRDPLLFRTIDDSNGKPTVYVRKMRTEGIYFKIKSERILHWLYSNEKTPKQSFSHNDENDGELRNLVTSDEHVKQEVYELLHTFSHTLIQNASINTGLETQSISEMLFPSIGIILLYSTNPINVGGLEYTYDNLLYEWLQEVTELAEECPQDPACMLDEGGSCIACLFVPEFVCENFNEDLDRDCLVGGIRHRKGFFDDRE
ncbi:MAG: hypothetical protein ACYCT2_03930 [Thermoplasmataceae archaeon]